MKRCTYIYITSQAANYELGEKMKQKEGLDWFQLDVTVDVKVEALEGLHGHTGFAVWIKLLQDIYKTGDHLIMSDMTIAVLSRRYNTPIDTLMAVVNTCLDIELFCRKTFETTKQLTSEGVKRRIEGVNQKREKMKERVKSFRDKIGKNDSSNDVTRHNDEKGAILNDVTRYNGTCNALHDHRVEKSRVEKSRVEKSVCVHTQSDQLPTSPNIPTSVNTHTNNNNSNNTKTEFKPESLAMPKTLDCPELRETWALWCEHLTEMRIAPTRTSAQLQLAQVLELGVAEFGAAVRRSIVSGWKSIHTDKRTGEVARAAPAMTAYERKMAMMDELIAKAEAEEQENEK